MLTERQEVILRLIIQNYTSLGQPVGSKKLMDDGIEASSATIRNEMKTLEEKGFLSKTHSSSGRVPSMSGYRYYIDFLLTPSVVDSSDVSRIRQALGREYHEIDDIIQQSATILSSLTSYTALSLGPDVKERTLTGFRIVPLNNRQIIAIIVTDKGNVQSQVYSIPKYVHSDDLEKIVHIVNDKLVGSPLLTVYHRLRTEIPMVLHKYFQSTDGILDLFDGMLNHIFEDKIFVGGRMNLLNFEQNQDVEKFKSMYKFMKDSENLNSLLTPSDQAIKIRIGSELGDELLSNMSLIQASYTIEGHGNGTIALLGPTSMSYAKMSGLLDVFRQELALTLADYYKSLDSSL